METEEKTRQTKKQTQKTKEQKEKKEPEKISRLNVLYILLVLKNHSSAEHPLSIPEIVDYVNQEYYRVIHTQDVSINNSTVTRILTTLMSDTNLGFQEEDIQYFQDRSNLGFNLYCVMKGKNDEWETYVGIDKKRGGPKKYYYYESIFSDAELITLIDSVETYNYFSTDDIAGLVAKLLNLRPKSTLRKAYFEKDGHRLKDEDSLVFLNIDDFSQIIKKGQFANITYCNYDHNKKLVPRKGYPRLIRPLSMMWSNGYYYLVALLKPGYTPANLRLDRITSVEPVEPSKEMRKEYQVDMNLDVSTYRMNHPVMHGGKILPITMLYLDSPEMCMSNAMIDTFGKITNIRPATQDELNKNLPASVVSSKSGTWMRADFKATTAGTELFATQYCRYCKVISPASLAEQIIDNLRNGLQLY